jgi:methionyl-tRNA formyltransferase
MQRFRIGFFGDGPWAHDALMRLLQEPEIEVAFVCVRFDTPDKFLLELADVHKLAAFTLKNVNSVESIDLFLDYKVSLFVSMSFNQIFKQEIRNVPKLGIINCHAGKLPFYRGRNILNWALINGEHEIGLTVHKVDSGIDTGDILLQRTFPISIQDDYGSLLNLAFRECGPLLVEAINQIRKGTVNLIPQRQISSVGTYFPRRVDGDELLDWNQTTWNVYNFIRALAAPGPLAQSQLQNQVIKFKRAELIENAPIFKGIPGSVIGTQDNEIYVKTGDSLLLIKEYEASFKPKIGDRFK